MAERRRPVQKSGMYVHGTAAYKTELQQVPDRRRQEEADPRQRRQVSHTVRRNQEKALQMDLPYVVMLTIAAICTLCLCVNYLRVQADINVRMQNIANLEKEIGTLKSANDALETSINTYVDLDNVYKIATEELGMVYANKEQVILYDKTESEYVRQYEDIPEN